MDGVGLIMSRYVNLWCSNYRFSGSSKELSLELEVVEPFSFMEEYKGQTSIVINPNYNPDFNECYDEDLRIEQQ